MDESTPKQEKSGGKYSLAYADALVPHRLNINEFALWWLAQDELSKEKPELKSQLIASTSQRSHAVSRETCTDLHPVKEAYSYSDNSKEWFFLDVRSNFPTANAVCLSLILDLARRLTIANPDLSDPLNEGQAVVLIDELDIHLHPGRQRDVVQKLTTTFPKLPVHRDDSLTANSGRVPPENIYILEAGTAPYRPNQSLGMDSNWICTLMDSSERKQKYSRQLG